jgi:hypothetical protein
VRLVTAEFHELQGEPTMTKTYVHAVALLLAAVVTAGEFAAAAALAKGQYVHAERVVLASSATSAPAALPGARRGIAG